MKSRLTIPNSQPLFQNEKWSIEKISEKEICITDGLNSVFGYYDKDSDSVRYDHINFPKYIAQKAYKLAKKHILPL